LLQQHHEAAGANGFDKLATTLLAAANTINFALLFPVWRKGELMVYEKIGSKGFTTLGIYNIQVEIQSNGIVPS
jgi:hypothetical protein